MSREQAQAVRELVDKAGWAAVKAHPVYGPLLEDRRRKDAEYTNAALSDDA